jgi:hypothetical protein
MLTQSLRFAAAIACLGACLPCPAMVQTIPLPGQTWEIVLDAPPLGKRDDTHSPEQYRIGGRAGDLTLSIFVEIPAKRNGGHRECREYYWAKGSRNPSIQRDSIKISTHEHHERVEYRLALAARPGHVTRHVNYYFAHGGRWVDVHVSCSDDSPVSAQLIAAFDRGLSYRARPSTAGDTTPPAPTERIVMLPDRAPVVFVAPTTWRSAVAWPENNLPPTVKFIPRQGDEFSFKITPIYRMDGKPELPTLENARKIAAATMAKIQPSATEPLELIEWKGDKAGGFYFTAQDKAPKSGEYPYLLQGAALLDELVLSYTVLLRTRKPETIATMLAVLESTHRHSQPIAP